MDRDTLLAVLPYFANILLKISAGVLDPRMMRGALEELFALPKPRTQSINVTRDQRDVIIAHAASASMRGTAVITSLISLFVASIVVLQNEQISWMVWALPAFLAIDVILLWWVLPQKPHYFAEHGHVVAVVALFCLYDIGLACLTFFSLHHAMPPRR